MFDRIEALERATPKPLEPFPPNPIHYATTTAKTFANEVVRAALVEDAAGNLWIGFRTPGSILRFLGSMG
jgi:hypothetical protein